MPKGLVHKDAVTELDNSSKTIQAVKMVFEKSASGRTAPGTSGINHIHVGGNANENLLYDTGNQMILGIVDGHMDSEMSLSVRNEAAKVAGRKGGTAIKMRIEDGKLVKSE